VRQTRFFILYWLPVVLWMSAIFTASGEGGSFQRSSRILGPFLHWLLPNLSAAAMNETIFVVRKCAHLTEYAILAFLVWRARRKPVWNDGRPWSWAEAVAALWVTVLYAATDEFHQTFVPSREGCVRDVFIDSSGAVAGLLLLWILGRWFKFW
jgi:VanZ family protein